jgi:serine protease AprX
MPTADTDLPISNALVARYQPLSVKRLALAALVAGLVGAAAGPGSHGGPGGPGGPSGPWASLWLGSDPGTATTSLADVRAIINAGGTAAGTLTGQGIGIALIDTGVVQVAGLPSAQIVNGPDLSFESQSTSLRYLDTYGHGTHMAGIMVGNDTASGTVGIAPHAKLTSIKIGTANGAVDVSQTIAAIDWVVAHRNDDSANPIKVLNLSYGTGGFPPTWTDPVAYAVEQAWQAGIVVVVAAGNGGVGDATISNPANDPWVIAVGAASTKGTVTTADDDFASFTTSGGSGRNLDLLAPGESIVSLRDPGSNIDVSYPSARVGTTLFRGSGSSQAAAITSAAVALILQARPWYTPDQVKSLLISTGSVASGQAAGHNIRELNVGNAVTASAPGSVQSWAHSTGAGALEAARGSSHVLRDNNVQLSGEATIFGPWNSATWAAKSAARTSWSGGVWLGWRFAGDGWTGTSWASRTWAGATWTTGPWNGGGSWTDPNWVARYWSGGSWSNGAWVARYWSSDDWSTASWE